MIKPEIIIFSKQNQIKPVNPSNKIKKDMILFIATVNCRVIVVDDLHPNGGDGVGIVGRNVSRPKRSSDRLSDLFGAYEMDGLSREDILKVLNEIRDTPTPSTFTPNTPLNTSVNPRRIQERPLTIRDEWMSPKTTTNPFGGEEGPENFDFLESDSPEKNFTRPARNLTPVNQNPIKRIPVVFHPGEPTPRDTNTRNSYPRRLNKLSPVKIKRPYHLPEPRFEETHTETDTHHFPELQQEDTEDTGDTENMGENFLNPKINFKKNQTKINNLQNSLRLRENSLNKLQKRLEEQEDLKKKNTDLLKNLQKNIERNEKELKQKISSLKLLNNEINEKQKILNGLQYDYNKKQKEKDLIGDLLKQYTAGLPGIENKIDGAENLIKNLVNEKDSETQKVCREKERLHDLMKESNQDMQKLQEALFKLGKGT